MKFKKKYFFLFLACLILFTTCKNDLKLNAPYKEIPNIYAVLNPQDKVNTIRINKVFLGEGNANDMAKVADSVNYKPGELTVILTHSDKKNYPAIIFTESVVTTNPGAFSTTQMVYTTSEKLATSGNYTLSVMNNKTGNVFTARSESLDSVKPTYWTPLIAPYYPTPVGSDPTKQYNYVDYSSLATLQTLRINANSAKLYQIVMRMHFYDSLGNGGKSFHYADYVFGNLYERDKGSANDGFKGTLRTDFRGADVFNAIGNSLSKMTLNTAIYGRKMYKMQFLIYSSTQDYMDYLEFAAPSLNIAQAKPLYSNFDNNAAVGIFTFRSRCSIEKSIANPFISEFQRNPATCKYNFFNADLSRNTCP